MNAISFFIFLLYFSCHMAVMHFRQKKSWKHKWDIACRIIQKFLWKVTESTWNTLYFQFIRLWMYGYNISEMPHEKVMVWVCVCVMHRPARQPLPQLLILMVKGQKTSPEVQEIILHLSTLLSHENIAIYTGSSLHTVERVLHHFRKCGTIQDQEKEWCES